MQSSNTFDMQHVQITITYTNVQLYKNIFTYRSIKCLFKGQKFIQNTSDSPHVTFVAVPGRECLMHVYVENNTTLDFYMLTGTDIVISHTLNEL